MVLILIAVMASTKSYRQFELTSFAQTGGAAAGVLVLTAFMVYIALSTAWETSGLKPYTPVPGGDIAHIGQGILIDYVLAFELASFILLGALVGAIVLVRPEPEKEEGP